MKDTRRVRAFWERASSFLPHRPAVLLWNKSTEEARKSTAVESIPVFGGSQGSSHQPAPALTGMYFKGNGMIITPSEGAQLD